MATEPQVVRIQTEGVQQAIADAQRLERELDQVEKEAKQAKSAVDDANRSSSSLTSFLQRAKQSGLLRRGGISATSAMDGLGNVLGLEGIGGAAAAVIFATRAVGRVGNQLADVVDEGKPFLESVERFARRRAEQQASMLFETTGIKDFTKLLFRIGGTRADVFDQAVENLKEDLFTTGEEKKAKREAEERAKQRAKEARDAQQRDFDEQTEELIAEANAKIQAQLDASLKQIDAERPRGFIFRSRRDFEQYRRLKHKVNEPMDRHIAAIKQRDAAVKIQNRGG